MLPLVCIAFAAGIAAGDWLALSVAQAAPLAVVAGGLALLARRRAGPVGVALLGLALAVGALAQAIRPRAPPELVDGKKRHVEATVLRPPDRAFGATRLLLALSSVREGEQTRPAHGLVAVTLGGDPVEPLGPGDRVRFSAVLREPRGFRNPGAEDAARRAAALGIIATAGVHDPAALARLDVETRAGPLYRGWRRLEAWRDRARTFVDGTLPGDGRVLVDALVLGDRGGIDRALDDAFRAAGVSHVLSVSGLHLAFATLLFYAGVTWLLLRVPRLGRGRPVRRWAALASLPAALAYTLVTGAEVATVRACVVAFVWLGGVALGRRASAAQAIAVAALVVLAVAPLELFAPSFQLSFAASLATALVAARIPRFGGDGLGWAALRFVTRLAAASAAALAATAPIAAWHFSQFAPAGLASNLAVVPLAELGLLPSGLAACVAHSRGLLLVAGFLAETMAQLVRAIAAAAPAWHVAQPSLLELAGWYVALGAIAVAGRRGLKVALVGALVVAGAAGTRVALAATSTTLRATFLDVGQGDACVVELGRHVAVIDGGGSFDPAFDPGRQVIAPFLHRRGIRRIDLIALSHPHPDHANGLAALVDEFPVGEVWTNGEETQQPGTLRLLEAARRRGVPTPAPHPLALGGARIVPLTGAPDAGRSENDNSLALAVEWGGRRLLYAGDLEADGEAALLDGNPWLRADVVKVPHHGSKTSSTARLVRALGAEVAVISVGAHNRWGFPHPAVVERWRAAGARVLRTDSDGAVTVSVRADGRLGAECFACR